MSCAGSIRGAIAFGLAISIDTPNIKNKQVLVNSTLILVFFTTIVFGAMMPFLIKFFKSFDPPEQNQIAINHTENHDENKNNSTELFSYMHPNFIEDNIGIVKEKDESVLKKRLSYWLGTYWVEFDHVYMKPKLVHRWPQVKDDNDIIAQKIKDSIEEYKRRKENNLLQMEINNTNIVERRRDSHEDLHEHGNHQKNLFKGMTIKN